MKRRGKKNPSLMQFLELADCLLQNGIPVTQIGAEGDTGTHGFVS